MKIKTPIINDLTGVRELRKALLCSIVASLVLSLFLGGLFIIQISSLIHLSQETDRSNKIIASIIDLQKTVVDMETGNRGYFLTKKKSFLEPFYNGKRSFPVQVRRLNELLDDQLIYYHEMAEISALMERWVQIQETSGISRLTEEVKSKKVMDQFRAITSNILDAENKKLEENKAKRIKNANDTIHYSALLALVLGFVLAAIIRQQIMGLFLSYEQNYNQMLATRKDLENLNSDLERKVIERTTSLKSVNDELETFCYSVSHDLRSPLRGIDGFSLALLEDYNNKLDDEGKKYLNFIRQGVQRMGQLIDDLLRLSRINRAAVQFQYFDIVELVSEVVQNIQLSHSDLKTQFLIKLDKPMLIYADRGLIRIVLENLFLNAVKYSSKEQFPIVEFGECEATDDNDETGECFYIKDNGVGFSMEHYAKLFAAFQRLHNEREYPGTGIGLATVRRIISRHGGNIWATSAPSKGSTFYFKIADLTASTRGGRYVFEQDASIN